MINVDTVYQKVLAIANKEQRGYITPQEFNLFANQAQSFIFEQYFYDLSQYARMPSVGIEYSDVDEKIDEKLSVFKAVIPTTPITASVAMANSSFRIYPFPVDLYGLPSYYNTEPMLPQIDLVNH